MRIRRDGSRIIPPEMPCLRLTRALLVAGLLFVPNQSLAGGGPENLVVVVNADSWASLTVANEYVALRRVPACNVIHLRGIPDFETVTVEQFRQSVLGPVLAAIERRGLGGQIDYVAYSADLPHTINVRGDVGHERLPKVITPTASINGLTYLYQYVQAKDTAYLGMDANRYFRRPIPRPGKTKIAEADVKAFNKALVLASKEKWAESAEILTELTRSLPESSEVHYGLSRALARLGKPDRAWAELRRAVDAGFWDARLARNDKALAEFHDQPRFRELLEFAKRNKIHVLPAVGFQHAYAWGPAGRVVRSGGVRYLLSTALAVTSGRGNSIPEVVTALGRAAGADGTRPKGAIYYMTSGDVRAKTRQWAFGSAVSALNELGVSAYVLKGKMPAGRANVQGVMMGTPNFDWGQGRGTILPGAICEHLTSFGGVLTERGGHTPLTDFLRFGAAGSCGSVAEPYAVQAKFPNAFLHVHYARGCTLAEAFYQSVAGPYQLLIVGDPLCRPWAVIPTVRVDAPRAGQTIRGAVFLRPEAGPPDVAIAHFELFVDGRRTASCRAGGEMRWYSAAVGDGHHELRVVAVAADPIATRGRLVLPVTVDNEGRRLDLRLVTGGRIAWDKPIVLEASLPGADRIDVYQSQRRLATIEADRGRVEIDALSLGLGPVSLHAVGKMAGESDKTVRSAPVAIEVVPPAPLPPVADPADGGELSGGLLLTPFGREPVVVSDTRNHGWLSKAGVAPNESFELCGYFRAPSDGELCQFQVRSDGWVTVRVDGRELAAAAKDHWCLLPVVPAKGWHEFCVSGQAASRRPRLDIRFGFRGTYSVGEKLFKHRQ